MMRFVLLIKNPIPLSRPRRYKKKTIENDERIDAGVIFLEKKYYFWLFFGCAVVTCRPLAGVAGRPYGGGHCSDFASRSSFVLFFFLPWPFYFFYCPPPPPHRWPAGVIAERLSIEGERERETKQLGNTR